MGLENRAGGKYITIMGGKVVMRVSADTKGAVARVNKMGKTVHELKYDSFTGRLLNIRERESAEYGPQFEFDFQDGPDGEIYTLQLSASNSSATNLLKILPNADLTKEMKIQPDQKMVDGKAKSSLFVSQDGTTLKHRYTKDNPNGMPPMVQIMVKGKQQWDDTDRLEFLKAMVKAELLPKLPGASAVSAAAGRSPAAADDAAEADDVFGPSAAPASGDDENENDF